jgi:hypothetical protein
MKSIRIIGITAFSLLGLIASASARQEKQEEKSKPAQQQEQAKPEKQQQTPAPKQQQQHPQQAQAPKQQPQHQQQAQAPKQEQPQHQQQQAQAPKQQPQHQQQAQATKQQHQQQASGQQQQQNSAPKQQQHANGQQQQVHQQQAGYSHPPQRTQQAMQTQRSQPELRLIARGSGRIPDDRFRSNFGHGHNFHMGNPVLVSGYSRFQYGGFWFGFVQPWPAGWYYTDDVYIDYVDGGYYMYNPYDPGVRFALTVVI